MRCAVLQTNPGEDALNKDAHTLCQFGHWLKEGNAVFIKLDKHQTYAIVDNNEDLKTSIERADAELYKGKKSGRNCYMISL